jgi:phosphoglycolate phosphatase
VIVTRNCCHEQAAAPDHADTELRLGQPKGNWDVPALRREARECGPRALDAIFLDLDGCLVDSTRAITNSFDHALRSAGIAPRAPEVTRSVIGPLLGASFNRIVAEEGLDAPLAAVLVERYRKRYRAMSAIETTVFDGIPETLVALRAAAPIAIVTSKLGRVAERLVDDIGLRAHIPVIYAPQDEHTLEPKEVTLRRALAASGARPSATVMVGDREHDVLAGHACGTATVGVLCGAGDRAELEAARAHKIVAEVSELPDAVRGLRLA